MIIEEAMKRLAGEPASPATVNTEEIARLMAYLVSREVRWLTGASVRMDGGEIKGVLGVGQTPKPVCETEVFMERGNCLTASVRALACGLLLSLDPRGF